MDKLSKLCGEELVCHFLEPCLHHKMMLQDGLIVDAHGQGDSIAIKGAQLTEKGAGASEQVSSLCLSPAEMHGHVHCRVLPTTTRTDGDWLLHVSVYRMPIPYCYQK